MEKMSIVLALATDHRGFALKEYIRKQTMIEHYSITWVDVGAHSSERSDYPVYGHKAAQLVDENKVAGAVLLCGSGVGMAIVANRYQQVYAAIAWNVKIARAAKADDQVNVLSLPADVLNEQEAIAIIATWLATESKGGIYAQRVAMINDLFDTQ